jgi:hypothetical protein
MPFVFQDFAGEIDAVTGAICEHLLCVHVRNDTDGYLNPGVFWLKVRDGLWHRFSVSLELPILSWQTEPAIYPGDIDDPDDYPVIDLGSWYDLNGLQILGVTMEQLGRGATLMGRLTIVFTDTRVLTLTAGQDRSMLVIG